VGLRLDHLDHDPDDVDGLLQRDRPLELTWRGAEELDAGGVCALPKPPRMPPVVMLKGQTWTTFWPSEAT
jgi:hypothetical protein